MDVLVVKFFMEAPPLTRRIFKPSSPQYIITTHESAVMMRQIEQQGMAAAQLMNQNLDLDQDQQEPAPPLTRRTFQPSSPKNIVSVNESAGMMSQIEQQGMAAARLMDQEQQEPVPLVCRPPQRSVSSRRRTWNGRGIRAEP